MLVLSNFLFFSHLTVFLRGIASYLWDFGDGSTGTGVAPTHMYSNIGTYTVTLMVKDMAGNNAESSATVNVTVIIPEFPSAAFLVLIVTLSSILALNLKREYRRDKHAC